MIQIIGIIEVKIFYFAFFLKLINQKRRGITTNQLGKGNKPIKTIMIERLLRFASMAIVAAILVSVLMNTSLFSNLILRSIGLVVFAVGTGLFIIAMITMKDSWRAGIPSEEKTTMITSGIYQFSRNPAFLGFDLTYIGASLSFGNIALLIIALVTIILYHLQILEEEKFLEQVFGKEYISYKSKVGRYFIFF
jgi:protein-S-isoprenylcysteine O-methyltransferase Ste14